MKLNKMKKRFFSLNRHNSEGFTLVELIVVIAILAILAGVGVPVYSGYIKQANMQADMTLISEIENALTLAGYSDTFDDGEGGYIILSTASVEGIEEGSNLEKALINAFGSNYVDKLKLKYGEWGNNGLYLGLYDPVCVYNSTYYGVSDQLMGQVEEITGAAANIVNNISGDAGRNQMIEIFGAQLLIDAAEVSLGMELTEAQLQSMGDNEFSNLLVFATAYDVGMYGSGETTETSAASGLVMNFAKYNGFASTEKGKTAEDSNGKTFADHYAEFVAAINADNTTVDSVKTAYKAIEAAADSYTEFEDYISSEQNSTDMAAFNAMMFGLTGAATANSDLSTKLNDPNFFSTGAGGDLFETYINSVEAAVSVGDDGLEAIIDALDTMEKHAVAIYFSKVNNAVVIGNSLP